MVTLNQLWRNSVRRIKKASKKRTGALKKCPQKRGVISKVVIVKPKKPNSARRHIANVTLVTGKKIRAGIPGEYPSTKHRTLKHYSKVYIRGGRSPDMIGVRYRVVLGILDAPPLHHRKTSRSKYGVKKTMLPELSLI